MNEEKPEALQLAEKLRDAIGLIECGFSDVIATNDLSLAAMELESLHARAQELEAKEAKPAAPVVWPEPIAHMNVSRGGFIATLQDEGPYVFPVYSQAQVRAMLEAQGGEA